jgi:hypothetical protein
MLGIRTIAVVVVLDPAAVPGAGVRRPLAAQTRLVQARVVGRVAVEEQVADVGLRRDPDLAVRMDLRPRRVEPVVTEIERVDPRVAAGLGESPPMG